MTKYKYNLTISSDDGHLNQTLSGEYDSLDELKNLLHTSVDLVEEQVVIPPLNLSNFRPLFGLTEHTTEKVATENPNKPDLIKDNSVEESTSVEEVTPEIESEVSSEDGFEDDEDRDFEFNEPEIEDENVTDDFDGMI